ncbi:MAG: hypothetical protein QOI61_461 [Actinomycetota bacterium]|jgi:hypothetical protein
MSDTPLLGRHDAVPRRRWRWLLPLLVGLAVVALVVSLVVRLTQEDTSTPAYAVNAYLEAVESGATTRAYGLLCAKAHQEASLAEFRTTINAERSQAGGVVGHKVARIQTTAADERLTSYTVRRKNSDLVVDAVIKREAGEWKMCGFKPRVVRQPANLIPVPPGYVDTGTTTTTR